MKVPQIKILRSFLCLNVKMTEIGKLLANLPYVFKSAFPIEDTQSLLSIFEVNELEVCNFMALEITFILIIVH